MKAPYIAKLPPLNRRGFLRGSGVALMLPFLGAMEPAFHPKMRADSSSKAPRRFLGICNNLGVLPGRFFPKETGRNFKLSPYLEELKAHRNDLTVFSGLSHPGVDGSHSSDVSFLTAAPHPASGGFRNSISLDQYIAGKIGHQTRFPSLTLGVNAKEGRRSLSWTDAGVLIPCENKITEVYKQLFLQGSKKEVNHQMRRLQLGQSIMDTVAADSKSLARRLDASDRGRLDQYLTAIREVERRMLKSREWIKRPKPKAPFPLPDEPSARSKYMEKTRLMYKMALLAFQTDSTRSISLLLDSNNSPTIHVDGTTISDGYHNLSHHGKGESKLQQLDAIDRAHMKLLNGMLDDLKGIQDQEGTLLDHSLILFGSNFGDANKHTTDNMPILVAGGNLKHGQHLAFDRKRNYPLPNLFVTMLQSMGIKTDQFASSTGTLRGLNLG
ncbi:DUF1552 domain-containing protein [Verrucomicrobia bacterium]|nr:DUF1552 domain-containing protein [Verrucomicrobiota bacterium]MDB4717372.1 DUF1552 domain-containing protein [Verrucomicrobiota bacterium]